MIEDKPPTITGYTPGWLKRDVANAERKLKPFRENLKESFGLKVGFCVITNKPERLPLFVKTLKEAVLFKGIDYRFAFVVQDPCSSDDTAMLRRELGMNRVRIIYVPTYKDDNGRVNLCRARIESEGLNYDREYIVICDDDCNFKLKTAKSEYSAGDRIMDCIEYLANNPDCGIIHMNGFFGGAGKGYNHGRKIISAMGGGYYATGLGMVLRGRKYRGYDLILPELRAYGATEDVMISFTAIANGYYAAKTFNVPIHHENVASHLESKSPNPNYDLDFIYSDEGIQGKFAKMFPPGWKPGSKLPKSLLERYERMKILRKNKNLFDPTFDFEVVKYEN